MQRDGTLSIEYTVVDSAQGADAPEAMRNMRYGMERHADPSCFVGGCRSTICWPCWCEAPYVLGEGGPWCKVMRRRTLVSAIIVGLVAAASASVRASFNAVDSWYDSIFAELARPTVEAIGEDECRETVAYHFWNVTNPSEFMHGARAPRMQAVGPYVLECKTYTYKSEESVSAGIVRTYAKKYYAIDEEASCAECTADAVFHVVNTYYATLQQSSFAATGEGTDLGIMLAFLPAIYPLTVGTEMLSAAANARDSLLSSPEVDAVAVASLSRGFADDSEWAIAQWANCGPLAGRPLRDFRAIPASKPYDFCGFLLGSGDPVLVRLAEESPLPVTAARAFLHGGGSDAEAKALASSGAHARSLRIGDDDAPSDAVARFVAAADANATAVANALGKGVTEDHVLALRAYVISFASAFVTPLVPWLLTKESANSGMVVRRTANELLFGYEDPLLALKTSKGSPEAQVAIVAHYDELESDLANLTVPEDEATENGKFPLTNGLTVTVLDSGTLAGQYRRHDGKIAVAFPRGIETVAGTAGVAFGQHLDALETQEVWHPELSHGLPYSYNRPTLLTTRDVRLRLRRYELAEAGLAPCSAANPRRCVYPDHVQGVWNATHAYEGTPLYFSQPHFVGVAEDIFDAYTNAGDDEAARTFDGYRVLGGSANTSDVVRARAHERHYDVEPWTGLALAGRVTTQYNVLARRSDILYPNLGSDNAITIGKLHGTLMPLYSATFEWKADDEICSGLYVAFVTNNIFKHLLRSAVPGMLYGYAAIFAWMLVSRPKVGPGAARWKVGAPNDAETGLAAARDALKAPSPSKGMSKAAPASVLGVPRRSSDNGVIAQGIDVSGGVSVGRVMAARGH